MHSSTTLNPLRLTTLHLLITRPPNTTLLTNLRPTNNLLHLPRCNLPHIIVMRNIHHPAPVLRSQKHENDDVSVDTAEENANDLAVLVAVGDFVGFGVCEGGEGEACADGGFDRGRGRGGEVA